MLFNSILLGFIIGLLVSGIAWQITQGLKAKQNNKLNKQIEIGLETINLRPPADIKQFFEEDTKHKPTQKEIDDWTETDEEKPYPNDKGWFN